MTSGEVRGRIQQNAGNLLVRADLFDEFSKDGKTSYAFRLIFQSMEKTLSDDEVGTVMSTVEKTLQEKGWEVR
jgi:phenylalanyl-tRNA synthetase beta subunit